MRRNLLAPLLTLCLAASIVRAQPKVIDAFDDPDAWTVVTAEGVKLSTHLDVGVAGPCLRLDYEFVTGSGYCLIQKPVAMELPERYEFSLGVRGDGPPNNLEFKLIDPSGDSVWWINRRAFEWPTAWERLVNKSRQFEFAWGPSNGAPLRAISKIEIAIASSSGGKGSVWLDDLSYRELPPGSGGPVSLIAPTGAEGAACDSDMNTVWHPAGSLPVLTMSLGRIAEFGGVVIDWGEGAWPRAFRVEASDDGNTWVVVGAGRSPTSGRSVVATPEAEAKLVRLVMEPAEGRAIGVREVGVRPAEFSSSPNAMMAALARDAPKGEYPRACLDQQVYWTVVGVEGDRAEALLSEDASLELGKRGPSIEPFIVRNGGLLSWANAGEECSLREGSLPIPTVRRVYPGLALSTTVFATGEAGQSSVVGVYTLQCTGAERATGTLALCVRPFQVNPPWQRLNFEGGVSPIRSVACERIGTFEAIRVNGTLPVVSLTTPGRSRVVGFDSSDIVGVLRDQRAGSRAIEGDPEGLASGCFEYPFDLGPGEELRVAISSALSGEGASLPAGDGLSWATERLGECARAWDRTLGGVTLTLPDDAAWIARTYRSQLAYILINRDGPAIQPGSRSYERSWARDGSMTSAALLACGHDREVREWIGWFGDHLFESGKVPCVVDRRGPDPVPENDSHGQYLWALANYDRHVHDDAFLKSRWESVQRVVAYIGSLRGERKAPEYADEKSPRHAMYGLMPESISHEGYSAKPMHSYWDDLFTLLGLKEGAYIAGRVGDERRRGEYEAMAEDMRECLFGSIRATMESHTISYIPGCVELGDFDSTSTSIIGFPCGEIGHAPVAALHATFDRYWEFFTARAGSGTWDAYTPYELRHVGLLVRLGERDRAIRALEWFGQYQRPSGWNHWAEVVWRDERRPSFLGDMPHTWVGSDFMNSVESIFVDERGDGVRLFEGVPGAWIDTGGEIAFDGFHTSWGVLAGSMRREGDTLHVRVWGGAGGAPGGFVVVPPGVWGGARRVDALPAELEFKLAR